MFKRVPGTKDILPDEVYCWQKIEDIARDIFSFYNYKEIRPPVLEEAGLFNRSLGEATEVVQKQMFLLSGEKDGYCLRPEGTSSIVRAYLENSLDKNPGFMKLYYIGPMFRRERPQKGRLRQFHHLGCEVLGSQEPQVDVEIVSLAHKLLAAFSIDGYEIKINSLGCLEDRKELSVVLHKGLKDKTGQLCQDCQDRFGRNILRILDCKNEACKAVVNQLGIADAHLCADCKTHFAQVRQGLDALEVPYKITPYLVRGLDYYTRTVFEISHSGLGSQDALGAGGRYDNLIAQLGGQQTGAIGFAFGIERLLLVSKLSLELLEKNLVYSIPLGEEARKYNLKLLANLRSGGVACDTDYEGKSLKGAMRKANDLKARYVVIVGEDELKKGAVTVKDMVSGTQKELKPEEILAYVKNA